MYKAGLTLLLLQSPRAPLVARGGGRGALRRPDDALRDRLRGSVPAAPPAPAALTLALRAGRRRLYEAGLALLPLHSPRAPLAARSGERNALRRLGVVPRDRRGGLVSGPRRRR